jgi:nuclear pore complex protein Nup98-Nup96
VLTKQDYYTVPPCDELDEMIQDGCCEVEGFTIGRRGYGEIHFPDKTDVYGMNLDQLGEELREKNIPTL